MTLLIATTNIGKLREIRTLLSDVDVELKSLADVAPVPEPEETGNTYWENARLKALAYAEATGLTTLADDSGLEIAALDGAPGVRSARFLGDETPFPDRFAEIFRRLSENDLPRDARFIAALAMARGRDILYETEAAVDGLIAPAPDGTGGFGYDPIFFYPPFGHTTAALTDVEKAIVSHRGRSLRNFARWLKTQGESRRLRQA
jgi:XTP/dITP diphosphohydrolase